jgi:hypothetical protein
MGRARATFRDLSYSGARVRSINVETDDLKEALTAYAERRPPRFSGREDRYG